jgi:hypothetical protein
VPQFANEAVTLHGIRLILIENQRERIATIGPLCVNAGFFKVVNKTALRDGLHKKSVAGTAWF